MNPTSQYIELYVADRAQVSAVRAETARACGLFVKGAPQTGRASASMFDAHDEIAVVCGAPDELAAVGR